MHCCIFIAHNYNVWVTTGWKHAPLCQWRHSKKYCRTTFRVRNYKVPEKTEFATPPSKTWKEFRYYKDGARQTLLQYFNKQNSQAKSLVLNKWKNKTSPLVFWWNIVFQWTLRFSEWQNCCSKRRGIPLQIHSPDLTSSLAWNCFLYSSCREGFRSLTVLMQDQKVWGAWGHEDHLKQKRTLERYC